MFTYKQMVKKQDCNSTTLISILRDFHWFISTETLSLIAFLLSLLELDIGISPAYLVFCDSKVHNTDVAEQIDFFVCFCTCSRDDDSYF